MSSRPPSFLPSIHLFIYLTKSSRLILSHICVGPHQNSPLTMSCDCPSTGSSAYINSITHGLLPWSPRHPRHEYLAAGVSGGPRQRQDQGHRCDEVFSAVYARRVREGKKMKVARGGDLRRRDPDATPATVEKGHLRSSFSPSYHPIP